MADRQCIFNLVAYLVVLEHHLLPIIHEHELLGLERALPLVLQRQWHGIAKLVTRELHTRIVGTAD